MDSLPVRLSDRKRLLILKCIRYAMDSASLWTYEPGPPVFELYIIARAMMVKQKGHPQVWQGHLENDEMKREVDGWIEFISRTQAISVGLGPSSPEPASPRARSESQPTDT